MNEKRSGFWQNVTGSVEPEDSNIFEAARRELLEETNLDNAKIEDLDLKFKFIDQYRNNVIEHCFVAVLPTSDINIVLDPSEHQDHKWIKCADVSRNHFHYESNFRAFQKAKEVINV